MKALKTLLLINDDPDDCYFFELAVKDYDDSIKLFCEKDSVAALKKISENAFPTPDLLFIDWNMPRISGSECLEAIKKCINIKVSRL